MKWCRLAVVGTAAIGLVVMLAVAGCGPKPESAAPGPSAGPAAGVTYTVLASELENPDNKPVYVCPMQVHKEQVSLDPDARCRLCKMRLVPLKEAQKAWGESGD